MDEKIQLHQKTHWTRYESAYPIPKSGICTHSEHYSHPPQKCNPNAATTQKFSKFSDRFIGGNFYYADSILYASAESIFAANSVMGNVYEVKRPDGNSVYIAPGYINIPSEAEQESFDIMEPVMVDGKESVWSVIKKNNDGKKVFQIWHFDQKGAKHIINAGEGKFTMNKSITTDTWSEYMLEVPEFIHQIPIQKYKGATIYVDLKEKK